MTKRGRKHGKKILMKAEIEAKQNKIAGRYRWETHLLAGEKERALSQTHFIR